MSYLHTFLPPDIPLIIKGLMTEVSDNMQGYLDELNIGMPNGISFKHDTWMKIQEAIASEKANKDLKNKQYPMVMLIEDIQQDVTDMGFDGVKAKLDLLIVCPSKAAYYGEQRRLNSFVPVLRPIYAEFMTVLAKNMNIKGYLGKNGYYPHQYREMYNMGTDAGKTAYKLPDYLDGIEIRDLALQFMNTHDC
jgi:hypothetical protein